MQKKTAKLLVCLTLATLMTLMVFALVNVYGESAKVWTDKADYSPEETVTIFGSGFKASASVTVTVERPDEVVDTVYASTDDAGSFNCTYKLDGVLGTYTVTATDGTNTATTAFTDGGEWTTKLFAWDMVSNSWVSGNLAGYAEGDLVGFKYVLTNKQSVTAPVPELTSYYDYFHRNNNGLGIDAEVLWQYNCGDEVTIDFTARFPPASYMTVVPGIANEFYDYSGGVRQNYYQFDTGTFPDLDPGKTLIVYFQAHLAETAYWKTVLDPIDPDPTGGPDPVPGPHYGAASFPGASLQVGLALTYTGTSAQTQSIPATLALGSISGFKFNDLDTDGADMEAGEPGLPGWTITLDGYDRVGNHIVLTTTTGADGNYSLPELPLGTFNIAETPQPGWTQSYPNAPPVIGIHFNVSIAEGARIVTGKNFGNYRPGKIIVTKYTVPSGASQSFEFDPSWSETNFFLTDGQSHDSCWLVPGTYNVLETIPDGWDLTGLTKNGTSIGHGDNITLGAGEVYLVNFTDTQRGKIIVDKITDPSGSSQSFGFVASGPNSYSASFPLTDAADPWDSGWLKPGSGYSITETVPTGWELQSVTVNGVPSSNGAPLTLNPGQILYVNFTDKELLKFLKQFTGSGALTGFTAPAGPFPGTTSTINQIKTGPAIWWEVTYSVTNMDSEGHYYILWDKWGGNLLILNCTPTDFNPVSNVVTLSNGKSFNINYNGYSTYLGDGDFTANATKGCAYVTLHKGDQQQGTNPGKGQGSTNDGSSYDADVRWEIGWLEPGETATFKIILAPGKNLGGKLQFSSWNTYVVNTGPRVRAYLDLDADGNPYENNEFQYSWTFTNQLTIYAVKPT